MYSKKILFMIFSLTSLLLFVGACDQEPVVAKVTCNVSWDGNDVIGHVTLENTGTRVIPSAGEICVLMSYTTDGGSSYIVYGSSCTSVSIAGGETYDFGEDIVNVGYAGLMDAGDTLTCKAFTNSDDEYICPADSGTCTANVDQALSFEYTSETVTVPAKE